jgi:hypothetical protein
MAFIVTAVVTGASAKSWHVDSSANADDFIDIPHGLGVIPKFVTVSPISPSDAICLANSLCGWSIDSAATDATNVRVRKSVQAGSLTGQALVVIPVPVK